MVILYIGYNSASIEEQMAYPYPDKSDVNNIPCYRHTIDSGHNVLVMEKRVYMY